VRGDTRWRDNIVAWLLLCSLPLCSFVFVCVCDTSWHQASASLQRQRVPRPSATRARRAPSSQRSRHSAISAHFYLRLVGVLLARAHVRELLFLGHFAARRLLQQRGVA
jgi:hypothetical protein